MDKKKVGKNTKLWNEDFFLLWQGQLVSVFGDVIYIMALNFWILDVTGSTALMGTLSALSTLPRIILGPFAGVLVDRWDRKKFIVITDLIRGIFVTFVGIAALLGFIKVWMVFVIGIISGICSAFFNPAIQSVRPDLVPESKLVQANSVSSLAQSGMNMIGSAIGGMIYIAIGAPYMFLFNGISYILSAFTELFINIPRIEKCSKEITFKEDFKEGFRFLWYFKTLKKVFLCASAINLFFNAGMILFLPYSKEQVFLGPKRYGIAAATYSLGMLCASAFITVRNIKQERKFIIYKVSILISGILTLSITFIKSFPVLLIVIFIGFACNAVFNTIFDTMVTLIIPQDKRGKVFALMETLSMGLMPLGSLIGGVLGELIGITQTMRVMFFMGLVTIFMLISIKEVKDLIFYDKHNESIEELVVRTNK
ncbi:MFS transporter [Hathewaya histolytica]|uniref:MFS family transporter protein n=1 Tax=Hathewaya histolytica TaxID=1498 RepID=A0A4V6KCH8_HATHI|nr:MFS transporter [Hathewaya histolytica]VTQ86447.1 MFS family transporter protein [Hathewaya histolytica]